MYLTSLQECISTIEVLLDLNKAMLDRNPEIRQAQRDLGVAVPALDEAPLSGRIWDQVDASYVTIKEFRDSSLDRWHRKALLGSGQTNLKGTLQRLDQTVSGQANCFCSTLSICQPPLHKTTFSVFASIAAWLHFRMHRAILACWNAIFHTTEVCSVASTRLQSESCAGCKLDARPAPPDEENATTSARCSPASLHRSY